MGGKSKQIIVRTLLVFFVFSSSNIIAMKKHFPFYNHNDAVCSCFGADGDTDSELRVIVGHQLRTT